MEFAKMYDRLRLRVLIRNFVLGFMMGFVILYIFYLTNTMKSSFPDVIAHSVIQGIIVMFWSHNIFQRNEFSRDIKRLSINFPETDQNVFYLILFSRLSNSKFEDNPQLAIRKMKRNNLWMGLKKPEFNADEIKKILEFLYP